MTRIAEAKPRRAVRLGRPMRPETGRAILRAAASELSRSGFADFAVTRVARRAGVSTATIYRRWPSRSRLVAEAVLHGLRYPTSPPNAASVRDALTELLLIRTRALGTDKLYRLAVQTLISIDAIPEKGRDQGRRVREDVLQKIRPPWLELVHRGVATGELRADVDADLALDTLLGAWFFRAALGRSITADDTRAMVKVAFEGLAHADSRWTRTTNGNDGLGVTPQPSHPAEV